MKSFNKLYIGGALFLLPFIANADITSPSSVGFQNPLKVGTICAALQLFLNALLTLAVPVAVLFLVYAGFRFVWARGNPKGLADARRNLLYVIIGIGIFLGAWLLGQIIANTLTSLGSAAGQQNSQIGACISS